MSIENDALTALRPQIDRISDKDLKYPNMPVERLTHHCEHINACTNDDAEHFEAIGFDVKAETGLLSLSTAALRETQHSWRADDNSAGEDEAVWLENRDTAWEMRRSTIAYISDALTSGGTPDQARRFKEVRSSTTNTEMIDDLGTLAELALEMAPALAVLKFGPERITALTNMYLLLNGLYGRVTAARAGISPSRVLRDRTFVFTIRQLDRIKQKAKLALREHPALLERYNYPTHKGKPSEPPVVPPAAPKPVEPDVSDWS